MEVVVTNGLSQGININFYIFVIFCYINFKFNYHMKKEINESYEEQVLKEFEETQEQEKSKIINNLGNIKDNKGNDDPFYDEELLKIEKLRDYHNIPLDCLPSLGRFYPNDTRISIRAARVDEIREFSAIDEDDIKDVTDKLTYMVSQCVKVYYGNIPGSYRDLLSADRIVLILKIREITFLDSMSSIKLPVPANACETAGCTPQDTIIFNSTKLNFTTPSPEFEKYYDNINKCYNVRTKSFGTISLYPPTIGVTSIVSNWIVEQAKEEKKIDASLTEILQYLVGNWRGLNSKSIFNTLGELSAWPKEKFILVYRLIEKINIGIEFEIKDKCETCGGEITVPITFPNGYKSLFIPTVSDFGDELL